MERTCEICGKPFEAKRKDARYCGSTCRMTKQRRTPPPPDPFDKPLVAATKRELEAVGKLDTMLGQQALVLAARMSGTETAGGVGTLSRELRTVMEAAIGSAPPKSPAAGTGDDIDELRARRNAKRAG